MNNFEKQSSTMTRLQFVGPVQWLWEIQFLDKKTQSPWKLTELRKVRKEKARASRALGKEKVKETPKEKVKITFNLEKESRQMEKGDQRSGPTIRILGTKVGRRVNSL